MCAVMKYEVGWSEKPCMAFSLCYVWIYVLRSQAVVREENKWYGLDKLLEEGKSEKQNALDVICLFLFCNMHLHDLI